MADRHDLPDHIYTYGQAAETARALAEYFSEKSGDALLADIANGLASVCQVRADSRYLDDTSRYGSRVTFVDREGEAHTALVMEPEVTSMEVEEAWDPYQGKVVNPQEEYPMGTVQLVYTPDYNLSEGFNFDRLSDLEVATSVTPASGPDETYCYYAGWDYALGETGD